MDDELRYSNLVSLSFHRIGLGALPPSSDPNVTKVCSCIGKVSSCVGAHHFMESEGPNGSIW